MKGNLELQWIFPPKVLFLSLLSFTRNVGTPLTAAPPQLIPVPSLAGPSAACTAFASPRSGGTAKLPHSSGCPLPAPQPPVPGQRAPGRAVPVVTAQQEMTVFPCCPPVATPQPGTLPRIPKFLYEDCLRLCLNLDCFLCSAVVAFTKTIGASKWREHGFVSGSLILIWNLSGTQGLIFNGCSVM